MARQSAMERLQAGVDGLPHRPETIATTLAEKPNIC
jgi:hypothetical protein